MKEKQTTQVVDWRAYQEKKKKCQQCIWYIQCRGPVPHDIKCPKKFEYMRD